MQTINDKANNRTLLQLDFEEANVIAVIHHVTRYNDTLKPY